jgi:cytidylate kinase
VVSLKTSNLIKTATGLKEDPMDTTRSGQHYGTAHMIERQMLLHYARARAGVESPSEKLPLAYRFITISRDLGSLGDEIAQELAGHLGWRVFDKEILDYISQNSHVRQSLVQQLDEKVQNMVHESVQRLLRMAEGGSFGIDEYHEALLKTLAFLAAQGESIVVGRGANFALRGDPGLHVRIVASAEIRAERLSQRWNVSLEEASLRMREFDAERKNFIRRHFKHDLNDLRYYDLIFNTDHLPPQTVVASILGMLSTPEARRRDGTAPAPLHDSVTPVSLTSEWIDSSGTGVNKISGRGGLS